MEGAIEVERGVRPVLGRERRRDVEERGRRGVSVLEGGRVEERLERGAGLARRDRHVDGVAVPRIAVCDGADHRDDAAGPGLDRDDRRIRHVAIRERREAHAREALDLRL